MMHLAPVSLAASIVLRNKTSTTAASKEAARSATGNDPMRVLWLRTSLKTAVFRPLNEKSCVPSSHAPREGKAMCLAVLCCRLDRWSARVAKTQQARNFVERLSGSVIQGRTQALVFQMAGHQVKFSVPAGNQQRQSRELRLRGFRLTRLVDPSRIQVPFKMVDANDG